jgi:hypothetical protein
MLSRARYSSSQEDLDNALCMATTRKDDYQPLEFCEDLYSQDLVQIGRYLSTLEKDPQWSADVFSRIRKKSYQFMLRDGVSLRHPKKKCHIFLRVIGTNKEKTQILQNLHNFDSASHKEREATYKREKRLYWWPGMYMNVSEYVETYKVYQLYSKVQHRDRLVPTYPLSLHYQWAVDVVHMPKGVRGARYLVLAIKNLFSYSKGRAFT